MTSVACLSLVATTGSAKVGFFALPQFPRLRIMMFVCIFTILFTLFVLFLHISHLGSILPFDTGKMVGRNDQFIRTEIGFPTFFPQQTLVYLLVTVAYFVASSLLFHAYPSYGAVLSIPAASWTKNHVLIASVR